MNEEVAHIMQLMEVIKMFNMTGRVDQLCEPEWLLYQQLCETVRCYEYLIELKVRLASKKYENDLEGTEG